MKMKNKVSWLILKSILFASLYLPTSINNIISKFITNIAIKLSKKNYATARLNIFICFQKSISPKQQHQLVKQSVIFSLYSASEIFSYLIKKNKSFFNKINVVNKHILDSIIANHGKAIIVSAHFGVFPLIPLYLAYNNYKINVVIKQPHNPEMKNFIFSQMHNNNIGIIETTPETNCYRKIINSIKNNESIMFMIDQTPTKHQSKIYAKFFNWNTLVYPTIAKLSKEYNIPLLPIFTFSQSKINNTPHTIKIYNEIPPDTPLNMIQSVHQILEELILHYPQQWWWFHKKWYNLLDYNNMHFYKLATKDPSAFFSYLQEKNCEEY
jgi:KDO2-lipid IV(A) lauroyltransferase